jgi:hypothetical protein
MLLTGDPRWTHRRRLVYGTVGLACLMIIAAMLDFTDRQVSSQLVVGGVSLISLILSGYVFAATFDDKWRNEYESANFDPSDGGSDDHGMAC